MSKRKLSCPIKERAAEMLAAIGVEVQEGMLLMATGRASERLLNLTNQQKIPEGLCGAAAEMTPEQRLDRLIAGLLEGRKDELYRYRRFVW